MKKFKILKIRGGSQIPPLQISPLQLLPRRATGRGKERNETESERGRGRRGEKKKAVDLATCFKP